MAPTEQELRWLVDLHEEHGASLHRLVTMLGAESQSGHIVRSALLTLGRRSHRILDPAERLEFVREEVVHDARAVRGQGPVTLPPVDDPRQQEILRAIEALPARFAEPLVISHYLSVFGPELAGILRMTVRGANTRLEDALDELRAAVGDPSPDGMPGAIDSLSQEITGALRASARRVPKPGTETLEDELREVGDLRGRGFALWVVVLAVVVALALGFTLARTTDPVEPGLPEPSPVPTPVASSATPEPSATASRSLPAQVRSVPVYYVGRGNGVLYRELRDLPASGSLVDAAIEAILALAPLDPDYDSPWGPGRLLGTELSGHTLTVDLTAAAYEEFTTPTQARPAVDQMLYTASELIGDRDLMLVLLADGGPPPEALGQPAQGFGRRGLEPMPALWLSSPKNSATVPAGQLTVLGSVKLGAEAPLVTITREDGIIVASATAQTATVADEQGWRTWSLQVSLRPGNYLVQASTAVPAVDPMEPEETASESKSITVQ